MGRGTRKKLSRHFISFCERIWNLVFESRAVFRDKLKLNSLEAGAMKNRAQRKTFKQKKKKKHIFVN